MTEEMKAEARRGMMRVSKEGKRENIHLDSRVLRIVDIICKENESLTQRQVIRCLVVDKSGDRRTRGRSVTWQSNGMTGREITWLHKRPHHWYRSTSTSNHSEAAISIIQSRLMLRSNKTAAAAETLNKMGSNRLLSFNEMPTFSQSAATGACNVLAEPFHEQKRANLKLCAAFKHDKLTYVCREKKKASWGWLNSREGLRWMESFAGSTEPWRCAGRLPLIPPASSDRPRLKACSRRDRQWNFALKWQADSWLHPINRLQKLTDGIWLGNVPTSAMLARQQW